MDDPLNLLVQDFNRRKSTNLRDDRFPNYLRSVVVETADPLNMGRVKFRCPELHEVDLKISDCPWAVPAPSTGGQNAGEWANPCIGDIIFICFEKNHPYGPIYVSAADPTIRRQYPLESVHIETPVYLDNKGKVANAGSVPNPPDDFSSKYLPNDKRPMSRGQKDRYGNTIIMNSIGFFPDTHFNSAKDSGNPNPNNPDMKYISLMSKYGHMLIMNDIGYDWQKEFSGDAELDSRFEIDRYKYLQRLISEDSNTGNDQRRIELRTRAGHKFEMRDTGWNKSRDKEYSSMVGSATLSQDDLDQRWIKFASKGGHLIQVIDKGFDAEKDEKYKTNLIDDIGSTHNEDDWKDARQVRIITRHGFKFVLDDRGSSTVNGEKEVPHGNGLLIKGRRSKAAPTSSDDHSTASPSASTEDGRGYGIEFNEKDEINTMKLYSPNSKLIEINDKYGFVLLCTDLPHDISKPVQKYKDNEFSTASGQLNQAAEKKTYHLILNKADKYARLKTPTSQGLELRDNEKWAELRDEEDRGVWLNARDKIALLRSGIDTNAFVMLDDNTKIILIQNRSGKIQLYSSESIEIVSDKDVNIKADKINLRAKTEINFSSSNISGKVAGGKFGTNGDIHCDNLYGYIPEAEKPAVVAGLGIAKRSPIQGVTPNINPDARDKETLSPKSDFEERGKSSDFPTKEVDVSIIKG